MTPAGVYGMMPGETIELTFSFLKVDGNCHIESRFTEAAAKVFLPVNAMPLPESKGQCEVKVQLTARKNAKISTHWIDFIVTDADTGYFGSDLKVKVHVCNTKYDQEKLYD